MKIAMFTDSYFPSVDGVVVSLTTTSKELKRRGHEVVVVAPSPIEELPSEPPDRVLWLPARRFGAYGGYRMAVLPSGITSLIRKEEPDIIHSHGIGFVGIQALVASRGTDIPNALTYHTMLTDAVDYYSPVPLPLDITLKLTWVYQRNFMKRPHLVIAPTEAVRQELAANGVRVKGWRVIPTGVDCVRFSPEVSGTSVRESLRFNDKRVILTLGRVALEKNLDLILSGFSILAKKADDARLVIAGGGPALGHYRRIVRTMDMEDRVCFTGFVPDERLAEYYAACDAFVIASKFETQGLVALEAMATGKPVAGINHRALAELISHGRNGFLFEDSPESCAAALESALQEGRAVSTEARRTADRFSIEKCTQLLIEAYEELFT